MVNASFSIFFKAPISMKVLVAIGVNLKQNADEPKSLAYQKFVAKLESKNDKLCSINDNSLEVISCKHT